MNPGFKKCKKKLYKQSSMYDITDANLHIFKHADKMKYNNILILEDDFLFTSKITNISSQNNVNEFCYLHSDKEFMYLLGCVAVIIFPYNTYTFKGELVGGAHAVIYSRSIRKQISNIPQNDIIDWDMYIGSRFKGKKYLYHEPLINQTFRETENKSNWAHEHNEYVRYIYSLIFNIGIYVFGLNNASTVENGFNTIYLLAKLFMLIIILISLYLVYFTIKTLFPIKSILRYIKRRI